MKRLFLIGVACWILFEFAIVYLIMPMPYSQRWRTVVVAHQLYGARWIVRAVLAVVIVYALARTRRGSRAWMAIACTALTAAAAATYATNFVLAADAMFVQPSVVRMEPAATNAVDQQRLVVGVIVNGEARAYPVQLIGYHHQVRDVVGGTPVMVTYCTVCRTGRVFSPVVDGYEESFRLVGMDRFNAMFEDVRTRSWWRQATGESVAGARTGAALTEFFSEQMTLAQWLRLHPDSLVMQPDPEATDRYSDTFDYENGNSRSALTGTSPESWQEKSWVVGITVNGASRAYDWNQLKRERVINDTLGGQPLVVVLAQDGVSFFAFKRPDRDTTFALVDERLSGGGTTYDVAGRGDSGRLTPIFASQEFWHSWRTFQPATDRFGSAPSEGSARF
jgi:Protein of unknown function (DUF3179)